MQAFTRNRAVGAALASARRAAGGAGRRVTVRHRAGDPVAAARGAYLDALPCEC